MSHKPTSEQLGFEAEIPIHVLRANSMHMRVAVLVQRLLRHCVGSVNIS